MKKDTPRNSFYMGLKNFSKSLGNYSRGAYCGERELANLQNTIDSYLLGNYDAEKKREASSHFLWEIKKNFSSSISTKAVRLFNNSYKKFKLGDSEKQKFLNVMLGPSQNENIKPECFMRFPVDAYAFFADYKSETAETHAKNDKMFAKIERILTSESVLSEDYRACAVRFYPFIRDYSRNIQQVNHKSIISYADVLFCIQSRCPQDSISLLPIYNMLQRSDELKKTPSMKSLFGDNKPPIDKREVVEVLSFYTEFVGLMGNFTKPLHEHMTAFMSHIVQNHDYSKNEIMSLRRQLSNASGSINAKQSFRDMASDIVQSYLKSIPSEIAQNMKKPKSETSQVALRARAMKSESWRG